MRGTRPNQIAVGNGSDELIDLVMRIFCQPSSDDHILICPPTYGMYKVTANVNDVSVVEVPLTPETFQIDVDAVLAKCTPCFLVRCVRASLRVAEGAGFIPLGLPLSLSLIISHECWLQKARASCVSAFVLVQWLRKGHDSVSLTMNQ